MLEEAEAGGGLRQEPGFSLKPISLQLTAIIPLLLMGESRRSLKGFTSRVNGRALLKRVINLS